MPLVDLRDAWTPATSRDHGIVLSCSGKGTRILGYASLLMVVARVIGFLSETVDLFDQCEEISTDGWRAMDWALFFFLKRFELVCVSLPLGRKNIAYSKQSPASCML